MKRIHLIIGLLVFVTFVVTGRYMRLDFPDKEAIPQDLRLLMRSRHIYILFSALLHMLLGAYLQIRPEVWRKAIQYFGSALLVSSTVLLIWAFIAETCFLQHFSGISRYGIVLSLAAVVFHVIGGLTGQRHEQ